MVRSRVIIILGIIFGLMLLGVFTSFLVGGSGGDGLPGGGPGQSAK